jgi:hypothetical protein
MPKETRAGASVSGSTDVARDKCIWTLTCDVGNDVEDFQGHLLGELGGVAAALVRSTTELYVTLQDEGVYSGALVDVGGTERPVDAVIELLTSEPFVPLDAFTAHLETIAAHVQGWRVEPTLIFDSTEPRSVGEPSASPSILVFVERLDGTTPEHFSRNWYIHAGHPDGQAAESDESRAERLKEEAEGSGRLYRQNRIIEPITPTAWLLHGYTQLQLGFHIPEAPEEAYPRVRGEEDFDKWPPRMFQGAEYRVL